MKYNSCPRRKFIAKGTAAAIGSATFGLKLGLSQQLARQLSSAGENHVVSIVRINDGKIANVFAHRAGMTPYTLEDIEIRDMKIENVRQPFVRPSVYRWTDISSSWGVKEI